MSPSDDRLLVVRRFTGIAVTKGFVASPHIDDRDVSHQYCVSLGGFSSGGELCVDAGCAAAEVAEVAQRAVHVVETKGRMAKVDGRHVHWVRTFTGGDRYSLVFYDTSTEAQRLKPVGAPVDLGWQPAGGSHGSHVVE